MIMKFNTYFKLMMTIILTIIILVFWSANNANACVDCDLNKEVFDSIKKGEVKIEVGLNSGSFEIDTGNEKLEITKVKLNSIDKNILKSDVQERWVTPDGQWCFVTIVIRQTENDEIIKREELHCSDTKYGLTYKQEIEKLKLMIELEKAKKPGYWELFAEFYYTDGNVPLYCRKYARQKSLFKKVGSVCLSPDGKWEVIN